MNWLLDKVGDGGDKLIQVSTTLYKSTCCQLIVDRLKQSSHQMSNYKRAPITSKTQEPDDFDIYFNFVHMRNM